MPGPRKQGILPDSELKQLILDGAISADPAIEDGQIQPASLDLRLGTKAYRLLSSFHPERSEITTRLNVLDLYKSDLVMYDMDLTEGAILEKGHVYLVPLIGRAQTSQEHSRASQPEEFDRAPGYFHSNDYRLECRI